MVKSYLISLPLILAFDLVWLGYIVKDFNIRQLAPIARIENGGFRLLIGPAVVAYLLMALSITLFSIPRAQAAGSGVEAFLWGAGLGLVIYGVFDMTNLAILKDYPLTFSVADMAWGTFIYGIVTWIVGWMLKR